jgi:hypothetical protein
MGDVSAKGSDNIVSESRAIARVEFAALISVGPDAILAGSGCFAVTFARPGMMRVIAKQATGIEEIRKRLMRNARRLADDRDRRRTQRLRIRQNLELLVFNL